MRLAALLLWALVVTVVVLLARRAMRPAMARHPVQRDELVKDPVCQTYIVRSRAVVRMDAGESRYFCSAECARRFARGTDG